MISYSTLNLATIALAGLTVWLMLARSSSKLESNWPLFYYLCLVAHLKAFEDGLDPYWVYAGVVTALFLRFEFTGGWVLRLLRAAETVVLSYVLIRCGQIVFER